MSDSGRELPDLRNLLGYLTSFVKSSQCLPDIDELDFQNCFPEIRNAQSLTQETLLEILKGTVSELKTDLDVNDILDPVLWEECADLCDELIESAELYDLQPVSDVSHAISHQNFHSIFQNTKDLPKPQTNWEIHNERDGVFVPKLHTDHPFRESSELKLLDGHGYDTRFGDLKNYRVKDDMVGPKQHCPHPYEKEIQDFTYTAHQLAHKEPFDIPIVERLSATWIDTEAALQDLSEQLKEVSEVAIDLEAHSHRSFSGFVCLMQISIRINTEVQNYLVDTLKLFNVINKHMAPLFANPNIVKIMHGADSDVQWLQRDFGMYIVNLFDTGRAARALQLPSAGYAYLLKHYVKINIDKTHQLSDWRQRPLPPSMMQYAIVDTFYLLDVYERLKYDLHVHPEASIVGVLDVSRKVSLIRYAREPFFPNGYKKLLRRSSTKTELSAAQEAVLKALWDWRDQTARNLDESIQYIATNQQLLRLALFSGKDGLTTNQLNTLFSPVPPVILKCASQLVEIVQRAVKQVERDDEFDMESEVNVKPPSSAFFKPATAEKEHKRRDMMSPVLGTEALYKQAGWNTPYTAPRSDDEDMVEPATTSADEDAPSGKHKKLLLVHSSNKDYKSSSVQAHNISVGKSSDRAAEPAGIRFQREVVPAVLGLVGSSKGLTEETKTNSDGEAKSAEPDLEEEFVIPRSIREIYMISNRNRRNKKTGSPTPERGVTPTDENEQKELEKANKILEAKGKAVAGYFAEPSGNPGKRQRTKSGRESEESIPEPSNAMPSKEDDLGFMKSIGWIKDHETVESLLSPPKQGYDEAPDPFFSAPAPVGSGKVPDPRRRSSNKPKQKGRQNERPDKTASRSHAYRRR